MNAMDLSVFRTAVRRGERPDGLLRKQFSAAIEKADGDARLTFVISTGSVDRDGDSVSPEGWVLGPFRKNPVVLWAHDYRSLPVGRATRVWVAERKLRATVTFAGADVNPLAPQVLAALQQGFLTATSVGFLPRKWVLAEGSDRNGIDFQEQELLEFSVVPVPANPEALVESRSAESSLAERRAFVERLKAEQRILEKRPPPAVIPPERPSTLEERLAEIERYRTQF